ncbi:hypothetical protein SprV_0100229100 [Sparganum proliferum]
MNYSFKGGVLRVYRKRHQPFQHRALNVVQHVLPDQFNDTCNSNALNTKTNASPLDINANTVGRAHFDISSSRSGGIGTVCKVDGTKHPTDPHGLSEESPLCKNQMDITNVEERSHLGTAIFRTERPEFHLYTSDPRVHRMEMQNIFPDTSVPFRRNKENAKSARQFNPHQQNDRAKLSAARMKYCNGHLALDDPNCLKNQF